MQISETDPDHRELLAQCRALGSLSDRAVDVMFDAMESRAYAPGECLMSEGEPGDCLYVLAAGTATARSKQAGGNRHIATFGPGEIVGEMALIMDEPRSASVVAETELRVLVLTAQTFDELAHGHPELGVVLTHLIADRLGEHSVDGLGGKLVGTYRIRRAIARGNMGVVYEAEDLRTSAQVALKMMSHRLLYTPGGLKRFQLEADLLIALDHPHITRFLERLQAFKTSFIAMEYCDGPTIARILETHGPLPEADVRCVLGQAASALIYLQDHGVVHRDLKPDNMLTASDGRTRLNDFGLAKDLRPLADTSLSDEHSFHGTPLYMAPEQITGQEVTGKADVYSLGCIALELLDGCLPFEKTNFATLVMSKVGYALPPAEAIGGGISQELHHVLALALAQDPGARTVDLAHVSTWAQPLRPELLAIDHAG